MANGQETRSIYLDTTSAQQALKKLTDTQEILTRKIQQGEKAGKDMSDEIAKMGELTGKIKSIQDVIDKGLAPSLREQEKLVRTLRNELRGMSSDADGFDQKRKAYSRAVTDLGNLQKKVGEVNSANNQLGGSFLSLGKNILGLAAAGIGIEGLFNFLGGAVEEANGAEQAVTRLHNTLDNLGRNDAFDRLIAKGVALQEEFKFIDNDDITGVFERLISYGKLTERQMGDLTDVIVNFSKKNAISLEQASEEIIKGLEGTSRELKKYGVNMSDGANVTERFNIIINQLKPKVDGAAAAFGETFAGKLAIARQEIKDTQEEIGGKLLPILSQLLSFANKAISGFSSSISYFQNVISTGSFAAAAAINAAELKAEADKESNNKQITNLINSYKTDAKGRARSAQQIIEELNKELDFNVGKLAEKTLFGDIGGQLIYQKSVKLTKDAIERVKVDLNPELDRVLGLGDKDKPDAAAAKAIADMRLRFEDLISMLNQTANLLNLSPIEIELNKVSDTLKKQIAEIEKLQKAGAISAKEAAAAIKLAQQAAGVSALIANDKDRAATLAERRKLGGTISFADYQKGQKESATPEQKAPTGLFNFSDYLQREKMALLQVELLQAKSAKQRRDAQIKLLEEEHRRELDNANLTGAEKLKIDEEFAQKREDIEKTYQQRIADFIIKTLEFAQQALSVLSAFSQARTNIENEEFKKEQALNDKKKRDLEINARKGLLTEQSYRIEILKMDQALDDKKRKLEAEQFERTRKQKIAEALINGALGITQAWVKPGFPLAILYTALIAANTVAQIGVINSQKPQFAAGGIADGPAHGSRYGQSGIALVRRDNGQEVGEMEGGEPYMILSKRFRQNNPGLIPQLLSASRTGQRLHPFFMERPFMGINYAALQRQKKSFAQGGIIGDQSGDAIDPVNTYGSQRMEMLLEALIKKLDQPSIAILDNRKIKEADAVEKNILKQASFQ